MILRLNIKYAIFSFLLPALAFAESYTVRKGDTLESISKKFDVSVEEIKRLNNIKDERKLREGMKLEIPSNKTSKSKAQEEIYTVQRGDTLETVAKKYGITVKEIMEYNGINDEKIFAGDELKIPLKGKKVVKRNLSKCEIYVLKKGGTLKHVSKKLGIDVKILEELNDINSNQWLKAGEKVCIGEKKENIDSNCILIYKPTKSTKLSDISKEFGIPAEKIKSINNLNKSTVEAGQQICLKTEGEKEEKVSSFTSILKYKVKRGDTLEKISKKFNVKKEDIKNINHLKNGKIYFGQILKIPTKSEIIAVDSSKEEVQKKNTEEKPILPEQVETKREYGINITNGIKLSWPVRGNIVANFRNDEHVRHLGIDIETECGKDVKAAEDGKVIYVGDTIKTFNNLVVIRHSNKLTTVYGYLDEVDVKEGQVVSKGETIGRAGKLKNSDSCGVYFEVRENINPINPLNVLE